MRRGLDENARKRTNELRCFLVAVVLVSGCRSDLNFRPRAACDPLAPPAITAERRDSLRPIDEMLRPDAQWAEVARTTPGGFAGIYFESVPRDDQGRPTRRQHLVIRLVHPDQRDPALRALVTALPRTVGGMALDPADVLIEPATWDFAQLDDWRRYLDDRVGSTGVNTLDTDEATNQIRYGVADASARARLERRLKELRVPCGLVAIYMSGRPRM